MNVFTFTPRSDALSLRQFAAVSRACTKRERSFHPSHTYYAGHLSLKGSWVATLMPNIIIAPTSIPIYSLSAVLLCFLPFPGRRTAVGRQMVGIANGFAPIPIRHARADGAPVRSNQPAGDVTDRDPSLGGADFHQRYV